MRPPTAVRMFALALVSILAASAASAQDNRQQHVVIGVLDGDEQPITDLTIQDVIVRENGISREILSVDPAPLPTHIGLLVDDSQVAQPRVRELREAVEAFLDVLPAEDRGVNVGLTTFGDRPTRAFPYSQSGSLIREQVSRLFGRSGAGATLIDAVVFEARELRQLNAARPIIVAFLFEDGPEFSYLRHADVRTALEEIGASLWVVMLESRDSIPLGNNELRERQLVVHDVTTESGGYDVRSLTPQGLAAAAGRIATLIRSRVQVTYGRPDLLIPPDTLAVEVRRPDTEVLAPAWTDQASRNRR